MKRRILFASGVLALAAAWCGPLPALARQAFFAHMTMHMLVVAVAAPLLMLALSGGRFDPVRRAPRLFAPLPASLLELVIIWAWHAPALHHFARHSTAGLFVEQGSFLLSGLFVWLAAGSGFSQAGKAAGVVALLLTSMHMTLLGALLALTPRPLYHHASLTSLTPLDDQQLGGAIMLIVGGIAYLTGGLWLTIGLLGNAVPTTGEKA